MNIIRSAERGKTILHWLDSKHLFSFGDYQSDERQKFGALVVFNDDVIASRQGFGSHPHKNMEIVTIVLEGVLRHRDSMGTNGVIRAGEIQRMSAGTGIVHSEVNDVDSSLRLLQIWVEPHHVDNLPSYEQRPYALRPNRFVLVASGKRQKGIISLDQEAEFWLGDLTIGKEVMFAPATKRTILFVAKGNVAMNGEKLMEGDAVEFVSEKKIDVTATSQTAKVLFIELA